MSFAVRCGALVSRCWFCMRSSSKRLLTSGITSLTNVCCKNPDLIKIATNDLVLRANFLTEEEESNLISELDSVLCRRKYQTKHWDYAIKDFRELERKSWRSINQPVISRLKALAADSLLIKNAGENINQSVLPLIHILDLSESGEIMPHVDSVKFCGDSVTVVSLLADCILRLAVAPQSEVAGIPHDQDGYLRSLNLPPIGSWIDILIPRRSVYVMRRALRYLFTHAVLSNEKVTRMRDEQPVSMYNLHRGRRVSVICRTYPTEDLIPFYDVTNEPSINAKT
ncbi:unnamed protein product [Heterobilharzia americana]|nr:unnamed protein product [Heterobilharzia americana]